MLNRSALVTGGTRGIGFAIAQALAKKGYNLVVTARHIDAQIEEKFDALRQLGVGVLLLPGDIANTLDRQKWVQSAVETFGSIDLLVNNAGVAPRKRADLLEMEEESFTEVMDINAKGSFFLTQTVAKQMLLQPLCGKKRGTIINVSSCSARFVSVNRGEYCMSKAVVSMATKLFAARLASEQIYVYEIQPGIIATDMTSTVQKKYDTMLSEGVFPIARWGTVEDVAAAVVAFSSGDFAYSTGICIEVDGGLHIPRL